MKASACLLLASIATVLGFFGATSGDAVSPGGVGAPMPPPPAEPPAATPSSAASDWPQWRGPGGMGISTETGLPLHWGPEDNLLWKAPIDGAGHSSPIVWGDRVFVTSAVEGDVAGPEHPVVHLRDGYWDDNPANRERYIHPDSVGADRFHTLKVTALDATTGAIVWERVAWEGTPFDDRHRRSTYASPTPITDGTHVFAYFGSQGIYTYDFDGQLVWQRELPAIPTWGLGDGISPVLFGDLLIIVADRDNGDDSTIVALDKRTGERVWEIGRHSRAQWSTPLIVDGPAGPEMVVSGFHMVASYDPATGEENWRAPGLRGNVIATPLADRQMVFVSIGHPSKITRALRLGASGEGELLWEYNKGTAYVPSNLLYDGLLYLLSDNGTLTALDAGSGELVYEGGRVPVPGRFMASPVGYDGKILLASQEGDMFVVTAGRQHEVLAVNSIDEAIWASPAISGGRLFVRGAGHLFCFGRAAAP